MVAGVLDWVDQLLGFDELITVSFQIVGLRHDTPPRWQRQTRVTRIWLDRKERKKPLYLTITDNDSGSDGGKTWWQESFDLCCKHSSRTFYFFEITLLSNIDMSICLLWRKLILFDWFLWWWMESMLELCNCSTLSKVEQFILPEAIWKTMPRWNRKTFNTFQAQQVHIYDINTSVV